MTVKGEASARLYFAQSMKVEGTDLERNNVEVLAKKVPGFPLLMGMSFLKHFNWSFNKEKQEFTISK